MNPPEMVVLIVVIVMVARVLRDRYRAQGIAQSRLPDPDVARDVARMADELARLRERVQVLERVITDGHTGADLDRQIERLRDR